MTSHSIKASKGILLIFLFIFILNAPNCPKNDKDKDGIINELDNCPNIVNPLQEDLDQDKVGDACDNCLNIKNSSQKDKDKDKLGDICDNCPTVYNPNQEHPKDQSHAGLACRKNGRREFRFFKSKGSNNSYNMRWEECDDSSCPSKPVNPFIKQLIGKGYQDVIYGGNDGSLLLEAEVKDEYFNFFIHENPFENVVNISSMDFADIDSNGTLDIVLAVKGKNELFFNYCMESNFYMNQKDDCFVKDSLFPKDQDLSEDVLFVDIDGDSDLDIVFANLGKNKVYLNNLGKFIDETDIRFPNIIKNSYSVIFLDLDEDNDNDLVFATEKGLMIYINLGNGTFEDQTKEKIVTKNNNKFSEVKYIDFDGDGDFDLIGLREQAKSYELPLILYINERENKGQDIYTKEYILNDKVNTEKIASWEWECINRSCSLELIRLTADGILDIILSETNHIALGLSSFEEETVLWKMVPAEENGLDLEEEIKIQGIGLGDIDIDGDSDLIIPSDNKDVKKSLVYINKEGYFTSNMSFNSGGTSPRSVAYGDFDNDGNLDLAVCNSDSISLFSGKGNGLFMPVSTIQLPQTRNLISGDFNNDGNLDLCITKYSYEQKSSELIILLGKGNFVFEERSLNVIIKHISSMSSKDFNNDGNLDIALLNSSQQQVIILLGNGDGTFLYGGSYNTGDSPNFIDSGDLNQDNNIDLIVSYKDEKIISLLLGNGDGTFQEERKCNLSSDAYYKPLGFTLGDFNNDRYLDIAVITDHPYQGNILLGNGDGTCMTPIVYYIWEVPNSITSGDFNKDGNLDIAVTTDVNSLNLLFGKGDGTFSLPKFYPTELSPNYLISADLNKDENLDIVILASNSNTVNILLGNGESSFIQPLETNIGVNTKNLVVADFNNDGNLDIAVTNCDLKTQQNNTVNIILSNGKELSNFPYFINLPLTGLSAGDINGDGYLDLAISAGGQLRFLLGNGLGYFFLSSKIYATGSIEVALADFNQDKNLDVVSIDSNSITFLLGDGNGNFNNSQNLFIGENPSSLSLGDFNGDGFLDIAVVHLKEKIISVIISNSLGNYLLTNYPINENPLSITISDINKDKNLDIAILTYDEFSHLKIYFLLWDGKEGNFVFSEEGIEIGIYINEQESSSICERYSQLITSGDFNQDQYIDLMVLTNSIILLSGKENGKFDNLPFMFLSHGKPLAISNGDFDNDGIIDVAVASKEAMQIIFPYLSR